MCQDSLQPGIDKTAYSEISLLVSVEIMESVTTAVSSHEQQLGIGQSAEE